MRLALLVLVFLSSMALPVMASSAPGSALECKLRRDKISNAKLASERATLQREYNARCVVVKQVTKPKPVAKGKGNASGNGARTRARPSRSNTDAPRSMAKSNYVVVDIYGRGDASTVQQALGMVSEGGTIYVRPGNHDIGNIYIYQSVRLQGDLNSRPVLLGSIYLSGRAVGAISLDSIVLESRIKSTAMQIDSGIIKIENSKIQGGFIEENNVRTTGNSVIWVTGGDVTINSSTIHALRDFSITVGGGNTKINNSNIINSDTIWQYGGILDIKNSTISGSEGIFVREHLPEKFSSINLESNTFSNESRYAAVAVYSSDQVFVRNNVINRKFLSGWGEAHWACVGNGISLNGISGNKSMYGPLNTVLRCP